jgi:hypothetical protein
MHQTGLNWHPKDVYFCVGRGESGPNPIVSAMGWGGTLGKFLRMCKEVCLFEETLASSAF